MIKDPSNRRNANNNIKKTRKVRMVGTALIATSDSDLTDSMKAVLKKNNFATMRAENCKAVLECLADYKFDLVVIDTNLKELDALDAIELIKLRTHRSANIVVVTDDASYESGVRIAKTGVYYTLMKPVSRDFAQQLVQSLAARVGKKD